MILSSNVNDLTLSYIFTVSVFAVEDKEKTISEREREKCFI